MGYRMNGFEKYDVLSSIERVGTKEFVAFLRDPGNVVKVIKAFGLTAAQVDVSKLPDIDYGPYSSRDEHPWALNVPPVRFK